LWKNQEIQDGGSKMAAVKEHNTRLRTRHMTSPAHVADLRGKSFGGNICPLSYVVKALYCSSQGEGRNPLSPVPEDHIGLR